MEIAACIVSVLALFVAIVSYYFNMKSPNQNKIFDEKIQAYSKIATAMRNDLHSDQLNTGLHKRLVRNNLGHKIFGNN